MLDSKTDVRPESARSRGAIGIVLFALALAAGVLFIQLLLPGV